MNTQSLVNWSYPLVDNNGYLLERSANSGSSWITVLSCSANTTSYYDNNITWGDGLWYRVSALNSFGKGQGNSATVFIWAPAPQLYSWQQGTTTQSIAFWNYVGGYTMSLSRSTDGGTTWPLKTFLYPASGGYYYIDDPVVAGTTYTYQVQELFNSNYKLYSNTATASIQPLTSSRTVLAFASDAGFKISDITNPHDSWEGYTSSLMRCNLSARKIFGATKWLFGGDNAHEANTVRGGYDGQIGSYLGPSQSFWPCIGNHDIANMGIQNYKNYFGLGGNFYSKIEGNVEVFSLNSYNDSGPELSQSSVQWNFLSSSLSTSRQNPNVQWRIALVHAPVVTSSGSNAANIYLKVIPWKDWGIDIVFSGHNHWIERLESGSMVYVINGTMCNSKHRITTASLYQKWTYTNFTNSLGNYCTDYVYTLLEATSQSLSMSFYTGSDKLHDTGSTSIPNATMSGYSFVLTKP